MAGGNERINTTLRQFQEKIQSASVDLEKSLTDLGERIRRVRVPEDLVALEVKNQVAQMTAGLRELQKVVREAVASVRDLAAEVSSRPAQPKSFWNKIRDLFP
jgi:methyl-accepting chemotaxis protein